MFLINLILSVVIFLGIYIAEIYGIEFILPPFTKFSYTDAVDILISFARDFSVTNDLPFQLSLGTVIVLLSIIPFITILTINLKIRRIRKKATTKYRIK